MKLVVLQDGDDNLWKSEEVALGSACELTNEVLAAKGFSNLAYDRSDFISLFPGKTYAIILTSIASEYGFEISPAELARLVKEEESRAISAFQQNLEPTPGTLEAMPELRSANRILALVSSSGPDRLAVCLEATGLQTYFYNGNVFSAQAPGLGLSPKPEPDVYQHAVRSLGVDPGLCVAVEDSGSGVRSAVAAGIGCVIGNVGALAEDKRPERISQLLSLGARAVIDDQRTLVELVRRMESGELPVSSQWQNPVFLGVN